MENATILYLIDLETTDDAIRRAATRVHDGGGFLRCVVYAPVPILPYNAIAAYSGNTGMADQWPGDVVAAEDEAHARAKAVEAVLAEVGVSGEVLVMFCVLADIAPVIARTARSADVIVVAENMRDSSDAFGDCVHAGLFGSPVGVMLNAPAFEAGGHVFLAWDDGDAAAIAVHKAMPLLKSAREITIGCFDPVTASRGLPTDPGADIAAWLTRHGCSVTLAHYPSGGLEIGQCIVKKATDLGADLIVMGAYGHSRMRQAIFGGTTRTMLEQSEKAVFLGC